MPTLKDSQLPPPSGDQAFELLCEDLLAECIVDKVGEPQRYGGRGQEQHGVDIVVQKRSGREGVYQCKCVSISAGRLTPAMIDVELKKLEGYPRLDRVDEFIILTTKNLDKRLQDYVSKLNLEGTRHFRVEIWFWQKIHSKIVGYPRLIDSHFPELKPDTKAMLGGLVRRVSTDFPGGSVTIASDGGQERIEVVSPATKPIHIQVPKDLYQALLADGEVHVSEAEKQYSIDFPSFLNDFFPGAMQNVSLSLTKRPKKLSAKLVLNGPGAGVVRCGRLTAQYAANYYSCDCMIEKREGVGIAFTLEFKDAPLVMGWCIEVGVGDRVRTKCNLKIGVEPGVVACRAYHAVKMGDAITRSSEVYLVVDGFEQAFELAVSPGACLEHPQLMLLERLCELGGRIGVAFLVPERELITESACLLLDELYALFCLDGYEFRIDEPGGVSFELVVVTPIDGLEELLRQDVVNGSVEVAPEDVELFGQPIRVPTRRRKFVGRFELDTSRSSDAVVVLRSTGPVVVRVELET